MKIGLPKCSNPIKPRPDGTKELWGLSGREWAVTMFALIALWIVMGLVFGAFMVIAVAIRDRGNLYIRPGGNTLVPT